MEWLLRMKEALDLMENRMTEPLELEEIARAACASPFHFQRMFLMLTGMTVAEYMRKRRLTLAAQELATSSSRVVDVALKYGYDSPESFTKAFRKIHGIPPSEARKPGAHLKAFPRITFHLSLKGDKEMEYRIEEKEPFAVVGTAIKVSCREGEHMRRIPQFWGESLQNGTVAQLASHSPDGTMFGICLEFQKDLDQLTYMIASPLEGEGRGPVNPTGGAETGAGSGTDTAATGTDAPQNEFSVHTIPAYTWAIFPCLGPVPGALQDLFCRIFQEWFPATGYEHAGGPEIEVYPPGDTTAEDYRFEIWIPIVRK